jgi:hypothetical protein
MKVEVAGNVPEVPGMKVEACGKIPEASGMKMEVAGNLPEVSGMKVRVPGNIPEVSGMKVTASGMKVTASRGIPTPTQRSPHSCQTVSGNFEPSPPSNAPENVTKRSMSERGWA